MSSDGFKPTDAMAKAARRGLELRKQNGGKGGTAVGVARARDIANKKNLSLSTVKRMHSFFSRHAGNEKPSGGAERNKDKGYISFLLWGGAAGKSWAKGIVNRNDKKELSMSKLDKIFRPEFINCQLGTVDNDKGTLFGVKVIEKGQINDARPYYVDDVTLSQIEELGNRARKGVKVRYTHVDQEDAMGSHLGRAVNFRIDGECVRADIIMAKSAFMSPKGNLAGYVLSLAEEDSESLGMSVAGMLDGATMSDEGEGDLMPLRFSDLYSADVVADPAATRGGLFSIQEDEAVTEELGVKVEVSVDEDKKPVQEMEDHMKPEVQAEEEGKDAPEAPEAAPEAPAEEPAPEGEDGEKEPVEASEEPEEEMEEHDKPMGNPELEKVEEEEMEEEKKQGYEKKPIAAAAQLFVDHFGQQGAMWFLEGRDIQECFAEKIEAQSSRIEELEGELEKFRALADAGAFELGEEAPVTQSVELSEEEEAKQKKAEQHLELRKKGMSESDVKWASAWNF